MEAPAPPWARYAEPELLNLANELVQQRFKHPALKDFQARALLHCWQGGDTVVVQPTAAGKSMCFQMLPILAEKLQRQG